MKKLVIVAMLLSLVSLTSCEEKSTETTDNTVVNTATEEAPAATEEAPATTEEAPATTEVKAETEVEIK